MNKNWVYCASENEEHIHFCDGSGLDDHRPQRNRKPKIFKNKSKKNKNYNEKIYTIILVKSF